MSEIKRPFTKPAFSIEEQLLLLKQRGLIISDFTQAHDFLRTIGYYRFSAYAKPHQVLNDKQHTFHSGTSFETLQNLYVFDRKLRVLVLDAIERIEVAFRVALSDVMCLHYSPTWYVDVQHFKHKNMHSTFMVHVAELLRYRSKPCIAHYFEHYSSPAYPPSWMLIECLSFGVWSKVFGNLIRRHDKKSITASFGKSIPSIRCLESWLQCLTDMRNFVAHHERVWNRIFPNPPREAPNNPAQSHRFYQQAYILDYLLHQVSPFPQWKKHLFALMNEYEEIPFQSMGFQQDWRNDPFWETAKLHLS